MIKSVTIKNNKNLGDVTIEALYNEGDYIRMSCENGASITLRRDDILDALRALRSSTTYYSRPYSQYKKLNEEETED